MRTQMSVQRDYFTRIPTNGASAKEGEEAKKVLRMVCLERAKMRIPRPESELI
jgi:hypothetical protein